MISNAMTTIFVLTLIALVLFAVWTLRSGKPALLQRLYLATAATYAVWLIAMLAMKIAGSGSSVTTQYIFDSMTYVGVTSIPVFSLLIAISFTRGYEKLPKKLLLLFVVPVIINIVVWTNPLHHLHYQVFSLVRSEIVFGPFIIVSGAYTYICLVAGVAMMLRFALRTNSTLYRRQAAAFTVGSLVPLLVSLAATFGPWNLSIAVTPLSFLCTMVLNGIAIYRLHLLDIRPIAAQHVLDWISDCYLVLSDKGLVISFNQPFRDIFGRLYGITVNTYLRDCAKEEDIAGKTPIYNLLNAVDTCRGSGSSVFFEQAITSDAGEERQKLYYIVEVTPLFVNERLSGFVAILKDITAVKKSMQQVQDSQTRMMEQERLAFLGQMVGGLAHNLKTPIMSISGCASAMENLVEECRSSIGDPEVTEDDFREIYGEMNGWVTRVRESCAYMSDIITAIKGQAAHATLTDESTFTLEDMVKRAALLMRHELLAGGCQLVTKFDIPGSAVLHGDINNLIQVLNNLLSNAIYAQRQADGGTIEVGAEATDQELNIYVKDTGPGIDPRVRQRLFKEMTTSKGASGTGLGLYISNAIVRGKFGGTMWVKDNPEGGAIFGISLPLESVSIKEPEPRKDEQP